MKRHLFSLFAVVIAAGALFAQDQQTTTSKKSEGREGATVREIEVQYAGPQTVTRNVILSNMRTTVGQPFSKEAIEDDVRNLYATGFFTNLRIFDEPLMDGVKVVVIVQGKSVVKEVIIKGSKRLKEKALLKEIKTKPGNILDEKQVSIDAQSLVDLYQKKAYPKIEVSYKVDTDEKTGRSVVTFNINEGGKYVISSIEFLGTKNLDPKMLSKQMKTKKENWLSWITGTGKLKKDQFEDDLKNVITYCQNQGYIDAEVKDIKYEYDVPSKDEMKVVITLFEGIQYKVSSLTIKGNKLYSTEDLTKLMIMRDGSVFSPKGNEENRKAIEDKYGTQGYIDTRVSAEKTSNIQGGTIDVLYTIQEGGQSYIQKIKIEGNDRTKDKVIRRELAVAPGEIYDSVKVEASKKRLQNLGYFSKVEANPEDTSVPNRKNLVIQVEEQRTGSLTFGAGFSSIDSLLGFVEVNQGNFDLFNWPTFTGGGQKARVRLQYGASRQDYTVSFTEPWFLDRKLALGFDAWYRKSEYFSTLYNQESYGFSPRIEKPWGQFYRTTLGYKYEEIGIVDVDSSASPAIKQEAGYRDKSSVYASIIRDTRDNVFLTRSGNRTELYSEVAGGPLQGDTKIWKLTLESSQYFEVFRDQIVMIRGSGGTADTWDGGVRVPIFDRYFLGGGNDMRGFGYRKVSPVDNFGTPIGGKTFFTHTTEYTYPIIERVRGAVFYDGGFVTANTFDFDFNKYQADVGVGLRLNLPIGPIRLDWAFPIIHDENNGSKVGKFNFNVGYQF
ncbi:MAG: outer membrane protein assembly factor BamA [Verrucomicrobiae bacterium]|nr:outer membrane protein assembly factor BamA [Verrucomicrobiae bacterium]